MAKEQLKRQRAADQTTITFSCSKQLKDQIQDAATADRRSVSNWICCQLEDALPAYETRSSEQGQLKAAEPHRSYGSKKR